MVDLFTDIANTIENMTKYDRFRKLCDAAHWMETFCDNVLGVTNTEPLPTQTDGVLAIHLESPSDFSGKSQSVFTAMCRLADQMYFTARDNGTIRITFNIRNAYHN